MASVPTNPEECAPRPTDVEEGKQKGTEPKPNLPCLTERNATRALRQTPRHVPGQGSRVFTGHRITNQCPSHNAWQPLTNYHTLAERDIDKMGEISQQTQRRCRR